MKKISALFILLGIATGLTAQTSNHKSITQQQAEFYGKFHFTKQAQWDSLYEALYPNVIDHKFKPQQTQSCTLTKRVFGWQPYWTSTTQENNINLSLLSDI